MNKYRIGSHRLKGWDYANNGIYFITIVTANRNCVFGEIVNGEMKYSKLGQIAYDEFLKSVEMRKELQLGAFCLMPNHLHAILILENNESGSVESHDRAILQNDHAILQNDRAILQNDRAVLQNDRAILQNDRAVPRTTGIAYRSPKSISSFVAQYKPAVISRYDDWVDSGNPGEKYNRKNPLWQSNYHDHIVRDQQEYDRIKEYIINNPLKWDEDDCSIMHINGYHAVQAPEQSSVPLL